MTRDTWSTQAMVRRERAKRVLCGTDAEAPALVSSTGSVRRAPGQRSRQRALRLSHTRFFTGFSELARMLV